MYTFIINTSTSKVSKIFDAAINTTTSCRNRNYVNSKRTSPVDLEPGKIT